VVSFNLGRSIWLLAKACRHLANDYTLLILSDFGGRCSVCTLHTGDVTYIIENKINLTAMSSYRLAELAIVCRRTSICWSGIPNSAWLRAPVSSWGSNLKYSVIKYTTVHEGYKYITQNISARWTNLFVHFHLRK